jgi:hypothetical protein
VISTKEKKRNGFFDPVSRKEIVPQAQTHKKEAIGAQSISNRAGEFTWTTTETTPSSSTKTSDGGCALVTMAQNPTGAVVA